MYKYHSFSWVSGSVKATVSCKIRMYACLGICLARNMIRCDNDVLLINL